MGKIHHFKSSSQRPILKSYTFITINNKKKKDNERNRSEEEDNERNCNEEAKKDEMINLKYLKNG